MSSDCDLRGPDMIVCIYCKASIHFLGLPAQRYQDHLFKEHNIMYDVQSVVERTLCLQIPNYSAGQALDEEEKLLLDVACQIELLPNVPRIVKFPKLPKFHTSSPTLDSSKTSPSCSSLDPKVKSETTKKTSVSSGTQSDIVEMANSDAQNNQNNVDTEADNINTTTTTAKAKTKFDEKEKKLRNELKRLGATKESRALRSSILSEPTSLRSRTRTPTPDVAVKKSKNVTPTVSSSNKTGVANEIAKTKKRGRKPWKHLLETKNDVPWFAGVEYRCQICDIMFYDVQRLRAHVKKDHCDPDEYLEKFEQFESKCVMWECLLCRKKVKRNFAGITAHLDSDHLEHTLESFQLKFGLSSYLPDQPEGDNNVDNKYKRKLENDSACEEKPWYQRCEYQCLICSEIFHEKSDLVDHVKKVHKVTSKSYRNTFFMFVTKKKMFKCQECQREMLCTKNTISNHMLTEHAMSDLDSYAVKHGIQAKSDCIRPKLMKVECPKVVQEILDEEVKENNLTFVQFKIGTCKYKCKVCEIVLSGSLKLWGHAKSKHSLEREAYKKKYGDPCVKLNKIKCEICHEMVRHELSTLTLHARKGHGLNLLDFYRKYYKNKKITTTPSDLSQTKETQIPHEENAQISKDCNIRKSEPGKNQDRDKEQKPSVVDLKLANQWAIKPKFLCSLCGKVFSRGSTNSHLWSTHKIKDMKMMKKVTSHECKLCMEKVSHKKVDLTSHFKSEHSTTLVEYFVRFIKMDLKKRETERKYREAFDETSWSEACTYTCRICTVSYNQVFKAYNHIKLEHKMKAVEYKRKFGPLLTTIKRHKCNICFKSVIHNKEKLSYHLRSHHKSLKEYYNNFILKSAKANGYGEVKRRQNKEELEEEEHNDDDDEEEEETENPNDNEVVVTPEEKLKNVIIMAQEMTSTLDQNSPEKNWMNGCVYRCVLCHTQFNSSTKFKDHIQSEHQLDFDEYLSNHGSPTTILNLITCQSCNEVLEHDTASIVEHLADIHQITPEEYLKKFRSNVYPVNSSNNLIIETSASLAADDNPWPSDDDDEDDIVEIPTDKPPRDDLIIALEETDDSSLDGDAQMNNMEIKSPAKTETKGPEIKSPEMIVPDDELKEEPIV